MDYRIKIETRADGVELFTPQFLKKRWFRTATYWKDIEEYNGYTESFDTMTVQTRHLAEAIIELHKLGIRNHFEHFMQARIVETVYQPA